MKAEELQAKINIGYPPTHKFIVAQDNNLIPTGVLGERVKIIACAFPEFFSGERLFDIGCNKGYFSHANADRFDRIVAIDWDPDLIDICEHLHRIDRPKLVCYPAFLPAMFRDFAWSTRFDRVFIGNGPHHLYREIRGHEWTAKVAALCSDLLLTEGAHTRECRDIAKEPDVYGPDFDRLDDELGRYFTMVKRVPAVRYTPDRFVTLWKRKQMALDQSQNLFRKKYRHDGYVDNNEVTIGIAATSPISNGLLGFTQDGWLEAFDGSDPYRYFENERELFQLHCEHEIYLARLGYIDIDPATINFWKPSNVYFDKSGVVPICDLPNPQPQPAYILLLRQSYKDPTVLHAVEAAKIKEAFWSRSPTQLEEAFKCAISLL